MVTYTGIVKSYGMSKGYGFVASTEIQGDIFFVRTSLPPELQEPFDASFPFQLKGKEISFELAYTEDGQPQATSIKLARVENNKLVGSVKSYDDQKGYGFISCSTFPDRDLFFSKKDLPPILQTLGLKVQGQVASFFVNESANGKLQAKRLEFKGAVGSMSPVMFGAMMRPMMGKGMGKGMMGMMGLGNGYPMPMAQSSATRGLSTNTSEAQRVHGIVKSFDKARGYGFIKAAGVPVDVYFKPQSSADDPPFQPGVNVSFFLKVMNDGKPQAWSVCVGLSDDTKHTGTIKSYNASKGFGFILVAGGSAGDIYFAKDNLPSDIQVSNMVGKLVEFTVAHTDDGKPRLSKDSLLTFRS